MIKNECSFNTASRWQTCTSAIDPVAQMGVTSCQEMLPLTSGASQLFFFKVAMTRLDKKILIENIFFLKFVFCGVLLLCFLYLKKETLYL